MSDNMLDYGWVEELYLMGASAKTIANLTKSPLSKVENTIKHIQKNQETIRGYKVEKEAE